MGSQLIYEIYLATLGGLDFLCFQEAVSLFGGLGQLLDPWVTTQHPTITRNNLPGKGSLLVYGKILPLG